MTLVYGMRYYNPDLGRWISRDPIGEMCGCNVFALVWNNPIGRIDILGLLGEDIIGIGEIPEVAAKLAEIERQLALKGFEVIGGKVNKQSFLALLKDAASTAGGMSVAAEAFVTLFAQAVYDQIQSKLEKVVKDIGYCAKINWDYLMDQTPVSGIAEEGVIDFKDYSFPALTIPSTWKKSFKWAEEPKIKQKMFYEACPDSCHWRSFYWTVDKDGSPSEVEFFSCDLKTEGKRHCQKQY